MTATGIPTDGGIVLCSEVIGSQEFVVFLYSFSTHAPSPSEMFPWFFTVKQFMAGVSNVLNVHQQIWCGKANFTAN